MRSAICLRVSSLRAINCSTCNAADSLSNNVRRRLRDRGNAASCRKRHCAVRRRTASSRSCRSNLRKICDLASSYRPRSMSNSMCAADRTIPSRCSRSAARAASAATACISCPFSVRGVGSCGAKLTDNVCIRTLRACEATITSCVACIQARTEALWLSDVTPLRSCSIQS